MRTKIRSHGFSFIEILVVICILGILFGIVFYSLGDRTNSQIRIEIQHLQNLLNMAGEEAVFRGREQGLLITAKESVTTYQIVYWDRNLEEWQPIDSSAYRPHELPSFITLSLEMDDQVVGFSKNKDDENQPEIVLFSSGEITPFLLKMIDKNTNKVWYALKSNGIGQVELEEYSP